MPGVGCGAAVLTGFGAGVECGAGVRSGLPGVGCGGGVWIGGVACGRPWSFASICCSALLLAAIVASIADLIHAAQVQRGPGNRALFLLSASRRTMVLCRL